MVTTSHLVAGEYMHGQLGSCCSMNFQVLEEEVTSSAHPLVTGFPICKAGVGLEEQSPWRAGGQCQQEGSGPAGQSCSLAGPIREGFT